MALVPSTVAAAVKTAIATNPNFKAVTPELSAVIDAISDSVCAAVNTELGLIKTQYNLHVHASFGTPPVPPIT